MNWTVSRRIISGFALMLALVALVTLLGLWALRSTTRGYDAAIALEREKLLTAFDARGGLRNANVAFLRYMFEQEPAHLTLFEKFVDLPSQKLAALQAAETEPELAQRWREAAAAVSAWQTAARQGIARARSGDIEGAVRLRRDDVAPRGVEAETAFEEAIRIVQRDTDTEIEAARSRGQKSTMTMWLGLILALGAGAVIAYLLNRAISGPLQETSNVLASSAAQIAASTTEQASGATESLAAVTQTAATVDQVVQTADQAAERARVVAQKSSRAAEVGREGQLAVEESATTMREVSEQVESIAVRILALAEQAQAIGEIISTVNDLADQTNLLALNAAIEAARAGEQGKGFAVVASEVRSLAEQSKAATVRVRDILGQIQRATSAAVMATETGSKQVAEGTRQANEVGKKIRALSDAIGEAAQAAAQISASASQQSTGMAQIRQAIGNIQQAAQQNLAATRQNELASQELSRVGKDLLVLVGGKAVLRTRG